MNKRVLFAAGALFLMSAAALAQAQPANPLTTAFLASFKNVQQNLEESAELMPEEAYAFRPTPEVRPFGEWIGHTAIANYSFCSAIKGEARPDVQHLEHLKTKAEISKALRDSFEYCAAAFKDLDDLKALAAVTVGKNTYPRVRPMFNVVASLNSHYGNIVVYLRLKGLVPPSTARAQRQQAQPPAQKK